jgi:glucosamine--fructose-6-phosphate aminotransferase (isomerizing)
MCGIVSYVGGQPALPILIEGLRRLEYRGYDSAGIAVVDGGVSVVKAKGKLAELEKKLRARAPLPGTSGIGHTRWATHGRPSDENAHPHTDCGREVAVIHNGIVENYALLRDELLAEGHRFASETDTEVLAHLVERELAQGAGTLEVAVTRALAHVRGTFGLAVVSARDPAKVVAARRGSPLVLGVGQGEYFVASDVSALIRHTKQVIYLEDDEVATLTPQGFAIATLDGAEPVSRAAETVEWDVEAAEKAGHPHFMLKEICEQPETVKNAQRGRTILDEGISKLGGLESVLEELKKKRHLVIISCGTSYYAGMTGRYILEELTDLSVEVELASEFRYRKLNISSETAVLAISQSGETADTLAAIREAKRRGALILGLVNVVGSSIARETHAGVYNHAGPEIGVASTKAFTSQLTILILMGVLLGRHRALTLREGRRILKALELAPDQIARIVARRDKVEAIAQKYASFEHFLFVGRKFNYPIALEGALKLKEIAYVHAEGYAAGELKHGPIALIDESYACVCIIPRDDMFEKVFSNMQEMKARGGRIIAVCHEGDSQVRAVADDVIEIPENLEMVTPILSVVPLQLLAYYYAAANGREIDKPRNLAKSVTVE